MLVKFELDGPASSVVVSHRFLETTYLKAARAAGGEHRFTMAHARGGRGALGRLAYLAALGAGALAHGSSLGDNALVSVFPHGDDAPASHTAAAQLRHRAGGDLAHSFCCQAGL
jgi:hypothetical protein